MPAKNRPIEEIETSSRQENRQMKDKARIIELQRSLKIARTALEKIMYEHSSNASRVAETALDEMRPLERKMPLQGLCGHASRDR